jgi:hypothetical protein
MAEIWRTGKTELSVRAIAKHVVLDNPAMVAGSGTKESRARRLERLFKTFKNRDIALPVSVYRCREAERHSVFNARIGPVVGPWNESHLSDSDFIGVDHAAVERVAKSLRLDAAKVTRHSAEGLAILKKCLPTDYSENRI